MTSPSVNRGLVHDCEALLEGKDTLRGTATLDWAATSAVTGWEDINTGGSPSRVTELDLSGESLSGSIPASLGRLFELTTLDLSSNSLTGDIPKELGWLYNLEELRLSGNSLTGCIPVALEDVATNDLSSLNLLYCRPPAPENLRTSSTSDTGVTLNWDSVASDTLTVTTHTMSDLTCGTPSATG